MRALVIVFLLLLPILMGCSTVRLTPTASKYVKEKKGLDAVVKDMTEKETEYRRALTAAGVDENVPLVHSRAVLDSLQEDPAPVSAQRIAIYALEKELKIAKKDVTLLTKIAEGEYTYFVEGSLFFSVEPVIAIMPHIKTKAIPSLGINYRPVNPGHDLSALSLQLLLGGALNPSNSDEVTGALGFGLSYPMAGFGSVSGGAIAFGDGDDSKVAPYISVTLGNFATSTK